MSVTVGVVNVSDEMYDLTLLLGTLDIVQRAHMGSAETVL